MNSELVGRWQAFALVEQDTLIQLDSGLIAMEFFPGQTYTYEGALNYREAGSYRVKSLLLHTTDTTRSDNPKKVVRIGRLASDTLVLEMEEEGRPRKLKFRRY